MERTDELKERIRQQPLNDRLEESRRRIGDMCSQGRCPKMTIPVQHDDDDFYINTTLADAQATIAALQARAQELEQWVQDQSTANLETMRHTDEMQSRAMEAEQQLTQRTAELEAANKLLYKKNCELGRFETIISDLQAELERVRGELVEAAHNVNVYQSLYSTSCMDRALLENELRDIRTLIAALPKVEGEINERFCTGSYYSSPRDYRSHVTFETALVALLKHRQGMEG